MKYKAIIFNDIELENLLSTKKNIYAAKKSLILYFFTLPKLSEIVEIVFLPESIFEDDEFIKSILPFFKNIGISITPKFIINEVDSPDYCLNPLPNIQKIKNKYNISCIHYQINFGKRLVTKSPKYDEYIINSQYNWTNAVLVQNYCQKNNINLFIEPNLTFNENSSEDFYIHMRQIFWEGVDIFRKFNYRFNKFTIIIQPFFPKLKGLRDSDILDSQNIANTTLRCINECLSKEKMEILIKSCKEFSLPHYIKYMKFFDTYKKDNSINPILNADCLKEYIKDWQFIDSNLSKAQENLIKDL